MISWLNYQAHERFVRPARETNQLWRLGLGIVVAAAVYFFLNQTIFTLLGGFFTDGGRALLQDVQSGQTPMAIYLLLFTFSFMTVGVGVAAKLLHYRSPLSLLGPVPLMVRQFIVVAAAMVGLSFVVLILPPWDLGAPLKPNMDVSRWLLLLPFSLIAVLIQVSAEEVVFRGYIQQQLAARFRSPLMWMVFPSVLFGLGHYLPDTAGENAGLIAIWAAVYGILMADLTARSGTLGPSIAVHFVNNISAILIVSLPDDLSGLALYLSPFSMNDADQLRAWLPVDLALMFVSWLVARVVLRR